ncbi:6-phosphogluconolactonase [Gaoshiqia sediminis]|uniref:6-phosphogluconolactonase n=1 Tax=Gaoshiqia sediminis TaxID=2986998 RepID=A0AA41Y9M0_9BACT|nr:6-phosphogluconolactonase [Gaoshiqia sediminis]MCW0481988.1 6-phosphogluconolactonase [Gaoshiqia sediminis]
MNKPPKIKVFDNSVAVANAFAKKLYQLASSSEKPFHLVLSGGSTPALLFDILARQYATIMPWDRIHFWWGDERCVPPTDGESNYRMTRDHLFSKIKVDETNIHRVKGEWRPEEAAAAYQQEIVNLMPHTDGWPVFDLIILGMGNDGHTASIFPHQMYLLDSEQVCAVATHPESGQKRVTLTGKVLNNAKRVFFLVTGKSKAERVKEIINKLEKAEKLPATHIRPTHGKLAFYFDQEAATGIDN